MNVSLLMETMLINSASIISKYIFYFKALSYFAIELKYKKDMKMWIRTS